MKVFYSCQVSNYTIKDGEALFMLSTDACVNLCVGLVSCIIDADPSIEFLIAVPDISTVDDYYNYYSLFNAKYHKNITFLEFPSPIGPILTRYHFDMTFFNKYKDMFKDIDVMINDSNTLTKNWNAFFYLNKFNIPIVSTNYFLDTPISKKVPTKIRYFERMMESLNNSDLTAFQCEDSKREALEAYDLYFKNRDNMGKITTWNTGVWYEEARKFVGTKKFDKITIYFGNRITDTAHRYNSYDAFAEAIGIVSEETDISFDAIMLNPTRKASEVQLALINKLSKGKVIVYPNDLKWSRNDYLEFISKAHISCNLFVNEVQGGITHGEAMAVGNIVVMPKINNYYRKFKVSGNTNYPFFCEINENKKIDVESLASKILLAIQTMNNGNGNKWAELNKKLAFDYESYEKAALLIIEDLKRLVKNK